MIKKIIYITSVFIFLCTGAIQAQRETYNWTFGNKVGLTWNTTRDFSATTISGSETKILTGLPTSFDSPLEATQGCFTLSDRKGKLLLFSNGRDLYNANKTKMNPDADMVGNIDNAQSGILFTYPGKPGKYVTVTTGIWSRDILGYTVIDMNGNDGLGQVESINNSFPAGRMGKVGGSITATRHANGVDYWVIAPGKGTPSYLNIWRFTPDGINAPDYVQLPVSVSDGEKATGHIKFSPDGKHFVWATFNDSKLFFGNFDNSTGKFSNIKYITGTAGGSEFYGVEFSRSGKYMYVSKTESGIVSSYLLYAFDFDALMKSANPQDYYKNQMKRITFPKAGGMPAGLQLGPDGRLYIARHPNTTSPASLYVIENPEQFNNLKIYNLNNFLTGSSFMGLPSFAASWFEFKIDGETEFCLDNVEREYTLTISRGVGSEQLAYTQWDFGDNTTQVRDNNVTDGDIQSHMHAYSAAGDYTITVTSYDASGNEITTMGKQTLAIKVLESPSPTVLVNDVCVGTSATMTVENVADGTTITWYNDETSTTSIATGKECSTGIQNTVGTVTFYVEAVNTLGCSSGRKRVVVNVTTCGNDFIPVNPHIRAFYK